MIKELQTLWEDIENIYLPKDTKSFNKIKCVLSIGKRVYWYYQEDLDFWQDEKINYIDAPYSGILIPIIDCSRVRNMEIEECVVIQDIYPVEKCGCEATWISLKRLLDNESLIEITEHPKVALMKK